MGQQQLLLITLSAIIVGVSIVVGIQMFTSGSGQANQDAVVQDVLTIASRAQEYYRKPALIGGGGNSYANIAGSADITNRLNFPTTNANGTYSVSTAGTATSVAFQGVGLYDQDGDNTNLTITVAVDPDSVQTTIVNR